MRTPATFTCFTPTVVDDDAETVWPIAVGAGAVSALLDRLEMLPAEEDPVGRAPDAALTWGIRDLQDPRASWRSSRSSATQLRNQDIG